jgi:hypothetical protein
MSAAIEQVQDKVLWQASISTVMNFRVPWNGKVACKYIVTILCSVTIDGVFGSVTGFIGLFGTARDYSLQYTVIYTH